MLSATYTIYLLHLLLFFFSGAPTTEIYTLSLHDALPISPTLPHAPCSGPQALLPSPAVTDEGSRSEEHTSELQSLRHLVCRLLLEKKNKQAARARRGETTYGL